MGIDWSLSVSVVLTGLALVFAILLILIMSVELTSKMVNSAPKSAGGAAVKAAAKPPEKQNVSAPKAPKVEAGIGEETVAAIMAAVSCMTEPGSGAQYAVSSISRAKGGRPVWGFAGMQQNTRPF